jgi:hypothetical protein
MQARSAPASVPIPSDGTMSSPFWQGHTGMSIVEGQATEGYVAVNGVEMYWRSTGTGGNP